MAGRTSKRATFAVATLVVGAMVAATPGAHAHGPDTPGWVEQAGNGHGASAPVISNLDIGTVLYSANNFTVSDGLPRSTSKYLAWGTRPVTGGHQLYVIRSGNDGISWAAPQAAILKDPSGADVPFILNNDSGAGFDVIHTTFVDSAFMIFYRAAGSPGTSPDDIHTAFSENGQEWLLDDIVLENPAGSMVGGSGFKSKIVGISDVIWNLPGTTTQATCLAASNPYSCRYVMYYSTEDPAGKRYTAVARSGNGFEFRTSAAPALSPGGAGAWDDNAATNMMVQHVGAGNFRGLYAGSQLGGASSIGWASSADGVNFTKSLSNPATPPSMFDAAATPAGASSLTKAQFVSDGSSEHTRVFTTRTRSGGSDAYLGATSPAPTNAPHVRIGKPEDGAVVGPKVAIEIYAGDTLGTLVGLDMSSLSVEIDGTPVAALTSENTIVAQYKFAGKKIRTSPTLSNGSHTLEVTISDNDGDTTTVSHTFDVDGVVPNTTVTSSPSSPQIGFPDSIGKVGATVVDAGGTGLSHVTARVVNPLGQVKTYTTHAPSGWLVNKTSANVWSVIWTAPVLDPHYLIPGDYLISILGSDIGGNQEGPDGANTTTVTVI